MTSLPFRQIDRGEPQPVVDVESESRPGMQGGTSKGGRPRAGPGRQAWAASRSRAWLKRRQTVRASEMRSKPTRCRAV